MYKQITIYLIVIILAGCSASRVSNFKAAGVEGKEVSEVKRNDIYAKNLTENAFFIQRADIEIFEDGKTEKFMASIKFRPPDTFLISIRSNAGIEAARVFLTGDTVLINDRINKSIVYGSNRAVERRYGLSSDMIRLLFGDFILNGSSVNNSYKCIDGSATVTGYLSGSRLVYEIDCSVGRPKKVDILQVTGSGKTEVEYLEYENRGNVFTIKGLKIKGFKNYGNIEIRYSKMLVPWDGEIEFIPGRNYEFTEIK